METVVVPPRQLAKQQENKKATHTKAIAISSPTQWLMEMTKPRERAPPSPFVQQHQREVLLGQKTHTEVDDNRRNDEAIPKHNSMSTKAARLLQ